MNAAIQTSAAGTRLGRLAPGVLLVGLLAATALPLAQARWAAHRGLSALTLAIVLGMLIGNTLYPRLGERSGPGVAVAKQQLLRLGIILYGLRLTLHDIGLVGWGGVAIDGLVLASTFALAWWLGTRLFGMDREAAMLIGAGSAICGAAAVLAVEPVVRGRTEQVAVAIATVVIFGTLGTFLYPLLFSVAARLPWLPTDPRLFGVYIGSTVHEVAQVVAAGRAVSPAAADAAVITKMVRILMLAPFLLGLSAWLARQPKLGPHAAAHAHSVQTRRIHVPWFAAGFIAMVLINSTGTIPAPVRSIGVQVDTLVLAMAMAALGLTTHWRAIRQAGVRPLMLAAILFAWLVVGGALLNSALL